MEVEDRLRQLTIVRRQGQNKEGKERDGMNIIVQHDVIVILGFLLYQNNNLHIKYEF